MNIEFIASIARCFENKRSNWIMLGFRVENESDLKENICSKVKKLRSLLNNIKSVDFQLINEECLHNGLKIFFGI